MIFFKKSSLTNTFGNNWLKLQTNAWKIKKKKMQCRMKALAQYHN